MVGEAAVVIGLRVIGIEFNGFTKVDNSWFIFFLLAMGNTSVAVSSCVCRVDVDGFTKITNS